MRKAIFLTSLLFFTFSFAFGQSDEWTYQSDMTIRFSESDSLGNPFLCATDANGTLWVLSSTSTSLDAVDALYKAEPGDTIFTLVDDYSTVDDAHSARGLAVTGNDIYVGMRSTAEYTAFMYKYPNGDIASRERFEGSGYGTYIYGLAATSDHYLFGGIIWQGPRLRVFNDGTYVGDCDGQDPGGPHTNGYDTIRDLALVPGGDYSNSDTPIYTSRNSTEGGNTGGVAKWTGGTQSDPSGYTGILIEDADSFLKWDRYVPYGLTVDQDGNLWATGTDTTRRWVKAFSISGNWATQVDELPSSTSQDIADPDGAPLEVPEDVAINDEGNRAYIIDVGSKEAYVFTKGTVGVQDEHSALPQGFNVYPAYPNPFNPATTLAFDLPAKTQISARIYDVNGGFVKSLVSTTMNAGTHHLTVDGTNLSSGVYFITISSKFGVQSSKVILLK